MWRFNAVQEAAIEVYNSLLPLVAINMLWFLLSITIVLMPPATAALYQIAYLSKKGHSPNVPEYLRAIKRWLLKSWLWGVGNLLLIVAGVAAFRFYSGIANSIGNLLLIATTAILVFVGLVQFYFWPYMVVQEKPYIGRAIQNAAFTILADPIQAFVYCGITLFLIIASVLLIAPIAVITPTIVTYLGVFSLLDWIKHHGLLDQVP
jgi:hypothetical protein